MVFILLMLQVTSHSVFVNESNATSPGGDSAIVYLDLTYLNDLDLNDPRSAREAWDTLHLAASVQGIVNRDGPKLYIRFMPNPDDFWWDYLRNEHGWLTGRNVIQIDSIEDLLSHFAGSLNGLVVYREEPWVGSNLASTIAGVENRAAIRYDQTPGSIYRRVLETGESFIADRFELFDKHGKPIWLKDMEPDPTGSTKRLAYLWLKKHCLDTNKVSKQYMGYYIDSFWLIAPTKSELSNCTLTNHDFFISHAAFFMDLNVWEEESPIDEPDQPAGTDVRTLRELMRSMYDHADGGIIHIGGFTPWAWKYTDYKGSGSKHDGVESEWKLVKEVSTYNGFIDADALGYSGMTNASFYQHFPLKNHYPQNPRPRRSDIELAGLIDEDGKVAEKSYIMLYMGDYDAAAWFNRHVPELWADEQHGKITCNWAFNPNLDRRAPHVMHYVRTHQSPNDWFISGDNGAGYLNPSMLTAPRFDADIPDGWDKWVTHNQAYYERYDLTITGFIIDGLSPGMGEKGLDEYMRFSPDGVVCHWNCGQRGLHRGVLPYVKHQADISNSPRDAANDILKQLNDSPTQFLMFRSVLQRPSWHAEVMKLVKEADKTDRVRFLDAYTFFELLKLDEKHRNSSFDPPANMPGQVQRQRMEN